MAPRIITVVFHDGDPEYWALVKGLLRSVARNAPQCTVSLLSASRPKPVSGVPPWATDNTAKLELWCDEVRKYKSEDRLILMDADCLILRDPSEVFADSFVIGYTVRPSPVMYNAGVVYLRCRPTAKSFMDRWAAENRHLYELGPLAAAEIGDLAGLNQAALHRSLNEGLCYTKALPCETYNSVQETWHKLDASTVVLHVKSALRDALFGRCAADPKWQHALEVARNYVEVPHDAE